MNWKFWQKNEDQEGDSKEAKSRAPTVIPEAISKYMVGKLELPAEWVWQLKAVERPCRGQRGNFEVRIYDENRVRSAKVLIANFESLDGHPELIILEANYNRDTRDVMAVPGYEEQLKAA